MTQRDNIEHKRVDEVVRFVDFGDGGFRRADPSRCDRVDALIDEARSLRFRDYDRLSVLAEEALELSSRIDHTGMVYRHGMAAALALLAHATSQRGDADDAILQISEALALLDSNEPSPLLGELHLTMGTAHFEAGDYIEALNSLSAAMHIAEEIDDPGFGADVADQIAVVYTATGHADSALDMQLRALDTHRELGDTASEAIVLNNLAYTMLALGSFEEARACAFGALHYAETTDSHFMLISVLDTIAKVLLTVGDLENASDYAVRGLELASDHQSQPDRADALMTISRISLARDEYEEALASTKSALYIAEKHGRAVTEYGCHALISEIQEKRGDYQAALQHYRRYHELERTRMNEETEARVANLQVEHQVETARKNAEIHRLRSLALEREVEARKIAQAELEAQASLDPLTGLLNRRHVSVLSQELQRQIMANRTTSLILFDIDHFKEINDTFGHFAGDRVLINIARMLVSNARDTDTPVRYGGDEFLIVLNDTDATRARAIAERIRSAIASKYVEYHDESIPITVSIGVATVSPSSPTPLLRAIEHADRALYAAKHAGRNCVVASARAS